ncbi:EpsG family protein [Parapedobacter lycopersici]|uniref:EpsG family protein n=1 Tax=Parapedobacter lycopersici TaxID=1864939 RepID=UPI0033427236
MVYYYILVFFSAAMVVFDFVKDRHIQLIFFVLQCLALTLFAGLRAVGVDNDSLNYWGAFQQAGGLSWEELWQGDYTSSIERGYMLLNKLVNSAGMSIHVVFMVMAVMTGLVNYTLIFKKSPFPFTSLLIYVGFFFFYRDFTQIRYALAAGVGMWAIFLFLQQHYGRSFLLVIVFAFIHSSVLIVLPFMLAFAVFRNRFVYFLLPIVGLVGGFFDPIVLIFNLIGLPDTLTRYVLDNEFGRGGYAISAIAQLVMLGFLLCWKSLLAYYPKRLVEGLFIALSLGSFINLLFISFSIMQRLSSLLFGMVLFALPYLFKAVESRIKLEEQLATTVVRLIFCLLAMYYGFMMIHPDILQPYRIL